MPAPEDYARWVYETTRNWGVWLPHDTLHLGEVGYFTSDRTFDTAHTTAMQLLEIEPTHGSDTAVKDWLNGPYKQFQVSGYSEHGTAEIGSRLTVSTGDKPGILLFVARGYTQKIRNIDALLSKMRDAVLDQRWRLDYTLVGRRLVALEGFAAVFKDGGATLNLRTQAPLSVNQSLGTVVGAGYEFESSSGDVDLYTFSGESTPIIGCAWRVRRDLRDSLFGEGASEAATEDLVFAGSKGHISREDILKQSPRWLFHKDYTFDALP